MFSCVTPYSNALLLKFEYKFLFTNFAVPVVQKYGAQLL